MYILRIHMVVLLFVYDATVLSKVMYAFNALSACVGWIIISQAFKGEGWGEEGKASYSTRPHFISWRLLPPFPSPSLQCPSQ